MECEVSIEERIATTKWQEKKTERREEEEEEEDGNRFVEEDLLLSIYVSDCGPPTPQVNIHTRRTRPHVNCAMSAIRLHVQ